MGLIDPEARTALRFLCVLILSVLAGWYLLDAMKLFWPWSAIPIVALLLWGAFGPPY